MAQRGIPLNLFVLGVWLTIASGACAHNASLPEFRPVGGLRLSCQVKDAIIYVDDKYRGSVAGLRGKPLILAAGHHRLEVRKDGYFSHYAEVTIVNGIQQKMEVYLRKELF